MGWSEERPGEQHDGGGPHTPPMKAASLRTPSSTCSQMHTAQEKNRKNEKAMHSCRSMSSFGLHRCGGVVCAAGVPQWVNRSSLERTGKEEKMHFGQSSWLNAGRFVWIMMYCFWRTHLSQQESCNLLNLIPSAWLQALITQLAWP